MNKGYSYKVTAGVLTVLTMIMIYMTGRASADHKKICINEVCSWNASINETNRDYDDYVELYNASEESVSLEGWYLSDDKYDLKKCELSGLVIEPGNHLLIFANGVGEEAGEVAFRINAEGETLFLVNDKGNVADCVEVPALEADTVWARTTDGGETWRRMEPSPQQTNAESVLVRNEILDAPVFSRESGFYEDSFFLELSAKSGETIYYTLDGSRPTEESNVYTGRIMIEDQSGNPNVYNAVQNVVPDWKDYTPSEEPVDKAVVVRAVAADGQGNTSDVATATYFVNLDQYRNVDVLSLTADPEDLFGDNGIYVTGKEYDEWYLSGAEGEAPVPIFNKGGRKREIKGNIQLFESGTEKLNQSAGLRIQGDGSRIYPKKRFSIFARKEYGGDTYFDIPLYPGRQTHSVVLNDSFADAFAPALVSDRSIAGLEARPVVAFLNGEYWYTTYMLEKYNKHYLADRFGVNPDNVTIIKTGFLEEGVKGLHFYEQLFDFIGGVDLTDAGNYETLGQIMDIQSYIDFMCANIYLCNMDMAEDHNYMLWRTEEREDSQYGDERWRWMLFDMDFLEKSSLEFHQVSRRAEINTFTSEMEYTGTIYKDQFIFSRLMNNEEFRKQFVLTFMDMANTDFAPERVEKELESWGKDLTWNDHFFAERFDYIVPDMAEEFRLQGTLEEVCLEINDADAGYIKVNTCVPDLSDGSWTGRYYTDYPVSITAVANEGYRFAGWQGDVPGEEETLTFKLARGKTYLKALFEKIE